MQIFIFIIIAIILYPILGTVFGILLTVYETGNDKLKIGILTFLLPLVYSVLLWIIFPSTFNNNLLWLAFYMLAVLIRDIVFFNRKYLLNLTVSVEHIYIEYRTAISKKKSLDIAIDDIKNIELSKMETFEDYPASLKYCCDSGIDLRFIILNKKTWHLASNILNAVQRSNLGTP